MELEEALVLISNYLTRSDGETELVAAGRSDLVKEQMIINVGTESKICGAPKSPPLFVLSRSRGCGRRINRNGECEVVHQIVFDMQGTWGRTPCGQPSKDRDSELGRQRGRTIQ